MIAVVYSRTIKRLFHARHSSVYWPSHRVSFISVTILWPEFCWFLAQVFVQMSGQYRCLAPFWFIFRSSFIAPVSLIIVMFCLAH